MCYTKQMRILSLILALVFWSAAWCCAAVPGRMSYQGKLTDELGSPVADGAYTMTFGLYSAETGGSTFWTETQSVQTAGGLFSVVLGSVSEIPVSAFQGTTWLGLHVNGVAIMPRVQITSAAYAVRAAIGETVPDGSITTARIANLAVTNAKLASDSVSADKLQAGSVTSAKLASGSVTMSKLDPAAVTGIVANVHLAADVISVRDHGARGDGTTDDTAAFQLALNSAGAKGGGVVYAPTGRYRIASWLSVPANVTLEGVWRAPAGPNVWEGPVGTLLLASYGEGDAEGTPFITLNGGSTLKGVVIYYPNQTPDLAQPKVYPWTISVPYTSPQSHLTDNVSVIDCTVVNPYQCLRLAGAGRHYVRGLYGQPLYRGVWVDMCYDVGRVENVHFSQHYFTRGLPQYQQMADWQFANGIGLIFGRTDWEYVLNTFAQGYKVGYQFVYSPGGANQYIPSGKANGNFVGLGADGCMTAVSVEHCWPYGLLITNGEFVGSVEAVNMASTVGTGVVKFTNCSFWGSSERIATVLSGHANFSDCNFRDWDKNGAGEYAITATGGRLTVSGCFFATNGNGVSAGSGISGGIVAGNQGLDPASEVRNQAGSQCVVGGNVP